MTTALKISILALCLLTTACSGYRIRKGSTGKSSSEIGAGLDNVANTLSLASDKDSFSRIQTMVKAPGTTVFYTEGPGKLGNLEDVMPLSIPFIMQDLNRTLVGSVQSALIYYIHQKTADGFRGGLVLDLQDQDSTSPYFKVIMINDEKTADVSTGGTMAPGSIVDNAFQMDLDDGSQNGTIVIYSDDLDPSREDLADVIQLKLFMRNKASGSLDYLGKINTMESF